MKTGILGQLSPFSRIIFSLLLTLLSLVVFFLVGILLAIPIFHINLFSNLTILTDYSSPITVVLLKYLQIIQSIGLFLIPPMLAAYFFENNCLSFLKLDQSSRGYIFLITLILMFTALPFINWLVSVNEMMKLPVYFKGIEDWMKTSEAEAAKLTEVFLDVKSLGGLLFNLLMIATLPAIGEELMFRGLFQRLLTDWLKNIHVAIFISAFFFAAMHLQFYGFLPRMMLGVLFGYLFFWTGSIWVPVFAHFINNGAAVVVSYLGKTGAFQGDYEQFGATENGWFILASILFTGLFLLIIYGSRNRKYDP